MPYIFVDNRDPEAAEGTENYVYYETGNWESLSRAIGEAKRNLLHNRQALGEGNPSYSLRTFPVAESKPSQRRWHSPRLWFK